MRNFKFTFTALTVLSLIQGCTFRINTVKYDSKLPLKKNDLFYHLPKTNLSVTIIYKIIETTRVINGVSKTPTVEYQVKNIDVKTFSSNDHTQLYIARGKNIAHKFFLKENIDFKFNDKGVIQTVETSFEDKSLESTESVLKGVAAIIKTITLAGAGDENYLQEVKAKISKAYTDLLNAIAKNNEKDIAKFKSQLKNYYELLQSYSDNNKEVIKESEKTYTFFIDPDKTSTVSNKKEIIIQPVDEMPEVKLIIEMNTSDNKTQVLATDKRKKDDVSIPGLLYPIPATLRTSVTVATTGGASQSIYENNITYAQYGNFGLVPVTSKLFTSRKTNLEFSSTTGALTTYKTESGSSSENLSKTIENSANLLKSTLTEIKYDNKIDALKKQKELKELKEALIVKPISQTDSLKSTLDLLQIKLDINKLQIEIDSLNKKK
jgi:hypothetical protein